MSSFRIILLSSLCFVSSLLSAASSSSNNQAAEAFLQQRISVVLQALRTDTKQLADANNLVAFAEKELVAHWDLEATLLSMCGRELWQGLTINQQLSLKNEFAKTLTRYFIEAYGLYKGQNIRIEQILLNKEQNKGWAKLKVEMDYLPDLTLEIKIAAEQERWWLQDLRFEGLQYSTLKRDFYQGTLSQQGADALLQQLEEKNQLYFRQLAVPQAEVQTP